MTDLIDWVIPGVSVLAALLVLGWKWYGGLR